MRLAKISKNEASTIRFYAVNVFHACVRSGKGRCLESMSGSHHQADEPVTGYNLGHDANKQCRLQFHDKSVPCRVYVSQRASCMWVSFCETGLYACA
ncbi:hypothetical protein DPMN_048634 [Dreissena polymorpha]|uniref:Uncharacterized protein n=1 Tax=Dreissena polymorpha TaxID=45954 RepID=A0A9D4DBZ3_DREPO|nr:hypothetical protein DPMN_048634 [Dreissena polymorpha]